MSEYKTYICDVCGTGIAKRFIFPCVGFAPRRIAEETLAELEIEAPVDLCFACTNRLLEELLLHLHKGHEQKLALQHITRKSGQRISNINT